MKKINIICAAIFLAAAAYLGVYMVQDKAAGQRQKPSIEIAEELVEVSVADGEEALLKGVTASDAEDGDLTDKVIVETVSRFTPDQHRVVTYAVVDSDKMVAHAQRELVYTDYAPIRFSMDKPLSFETDDTDLAGAVHAQDCLDGDISGSIRMTSEEGIDTENPGMYSAELKVTNSAGDTAVQDRSGFLPQIRQDQGIRVPLYQGRGDLRRGRGRSGQYDRLQICEHREQCKS